MSVPGGGAVVGRYGGYDREATSRPPPPDVHPRQNGIPVALTTYLRNRTAAPGTATEHHGFTEV